MPNPTIEQLILLALCIVGAPVAFSLVVAAIMTGAMLWSAWRDR